MPQSSTSSPLGAAGCDKGVGDQYLGKAAPGLFNAGKKWRASVKAARQEAEKIVPVVWFFFSPLKSVNQSLTLQHVKENPTSQMQR